MKSQRFVIARKAVGIPQFVGVSLRQVRLVSHDSDQKSVFESRPAAESFIRENQLPFDKYRIQSVD